MSPFESRHDCHSHPPGAGTQLNARSSYSTSHPLRGGIRPTNTRENSMTTHEIATREAWLAARLELLADEKELTRRSDELAKRRQDLPWVRVNKEYRFETERGSAS